MLRAACTSWPELHLSAIAIAALLTVPAGARAQIADPPPASTAEAPFASQLEALTRAIDETSRWIASEELPQTSELYAGAAGLVPFWIELAAARKDAAAEERARAIARGLRAGESSGLYTGLAGVAWTRALAGEAELARADVQTLLGRAQTKDAQLSWSASLDVIDGAAGIGFALLALHRELGIEQALRGARGAGETLLDAAEEQEAGLRWRPALGSPREYPNFSHGTAGIAAFLLELGRVCEEERFTQAAERGARYLAAIAQPIGEHGLAVHHSSPGNEKLLYVGWCHGPTGTAPFFARLALLRGAEHWAASEQRLACGLRELAPPQTSAGFWGNVSRCCGHAGVLEFLLARAERAPEASDRALAERVLADLLARATRDEAGMRWKQAEHRARPQELRAQVGLMQGAAGIGLALLRCEAALQGRAIRVRFPDEITALPR
ncbi:MAG: hypothetical protein IPN34_22640 [Planctomycetes bacterium]|nr:hypothetical protein [Planctomycetota bacterium]